MERAACCHSIITAANPCSCSLEPTPSLEPWSNIYDILRHITTYYDMSMSYDMSDISDMPKWRRGRVHMSSHVILSSDISDIFDISDISEMSGKCHGVYRDMCATPQVTNRALISGGLSVIYWYRGTWHTRVGVWTWRGGEGGERRAQSFHDK